MGLFNFWKKNEKIEDKIKLAIQRKDPDPSVIEESLKERRRQPQPVVHYAMPGRRHAALRSGTDRDSRGVELGSPYDLAECIKLQDIESYFATSVDRHVELIMKDGYYLEGKNPETIAYVERRLDEISMISNQAFDDMLRELIRNCVTAANGYFVFKRDPTRSTGRRIRMWGRELDPISAIYIPDPSSVTCRQNKTGNVYQWIQTIETEKKHWPYLDVIHIPIRKKSSFVFGTPYVIPVLEDIRALRKLEMLAEHIAHKYAFPLMHWKVGTEERPADFVADMNGGQQIPEVVAAEEIAKIMAQEGFACTSERHEIKFIGVEGQALKIEDYVKHYEMRVLGGLRLSEIDLGRGDTANRGTAKVISQILVDACREIQETVRSALNAKLLNLLVLEGGFDLSVENRVYINFPPIDKEEERAQEMHGMVLYQSGAITLAELRQEYLGRNPMSDEDMSDTFLENWLIPLAEATAEAKAAAKPAPTGATKASAATSIAMPTNQYGTNVKPKLPANDQIKDIWTDCSKNVINAVGRGEDVRPLFNQAIRNIVGAVSDTVYVSWAEGLKKAAFDAKVQLPQDITKGTLDKYMLFIKNKDLQSLARVCMINAGLDFNSGLASGEAKVSVAPAFSAVENILLGKLERSADGAGKLGYLAGLKEAGVQKVLAVDDEGRTQEYDVDEPGITHVAANPKIVEFKPVPVTNE